MKLEDAIIRFRALAKDLNFDKDQAIFYINMGWQETAIRSGVLRGCVHTPLVADQYEYELDPVACKDMVKPIKVSVVGVGSLKICGQDELVDNYTDALTHLGSPEKCSLINKESNRIILLSPTPTGSIPTDTSEGYDQTNDGLWVWFVKNNPYVSNDGDTPELPDEWAYIGLFYAVWLAKNDINRYNEFEKLLATRKTYLLENETVIRQPVYQT